MNKNQSRLRRAKRTRMNFKFQSLPRLTVFKSSKHLYAQVIEPDGNKVITSASSHDKSISEKTSNLKTAEKIGQLIAERALEKARRVHRELVDEFLDAKNEDEDDNSVENQDNF